MPALIAFAHIVGAVFVTFLLGIAMMVFHGWATNRALNATEQEASVALGVSLEKLKEPAFLEPLLKYSAARHSSELFRNRISDLCGWVMTGWNWIASIVQVVTLCAVLWFTCTNDKADAPFAWLLIPITIFFWVTALVFSFVCKVLTGRHPGQAASSRKKLAAYYAEAQSGK